MKCFEAKWTGGDLPAGTIVVREGHAGHWKPWDEKPVMNPAGAFFARLIKADVAHGEAYIELDPDAVITPPAEEPETPKEA